MTKEIIVNAGELEARVAILENGRLMELHVEREPKIVGNIYKGRVTKVLKGMDAAFVDIGIERNAFLAASDVVAADDDDTGSHGRGRGNIPPINQLLHNNQEILVQVVRAPLGTKGARITTRLSLPGRYMVLMMNSGTHVGVSRKIENGMERQRLRTIANELRHDNYSLIVRTEAEGKSEEELRQDMSFLIEMAQRIERKASSTPCPALVHGDLTLIFRLIRDSFTRDVNRLVVDSPASYENVLELVGMLAPRMKNRVTLYDEAMPIFHAYNIEPEIERTLRRKIWLPSGGYLIIDQAEALTAIDVNTGRFIGTTELAETVLTTNLQAADEAARQLRLRDLGGIIVVDFIDMDNPQHRQQVTRVFEEALKRDRAKLKVHSISPLGLVEMTRKRTGESLVSLLTEPCPFCSGIGRVQNALTMALRIEREIAATAVQHPETEAYMLYAHPRVIGNMLGFEGEAQRDLQLYLERPVYLRMEENFHPNAYRLERLSLEQALVAVPHLEDNEVIEGVVMNPDPDISLSPLVQAKGCYLVVPELDAPVGAHVKVRITEAGTSLSFAEPLAPELRAIRTNSPVLPVHEPQLISDYLLPAYLRDEKQISPPRGLQLLSPTAESVPEPVDENPTAAIPESEVSEVARRRRKSRRKKTFEEHTDDTLIPFLDQPETSAESVVIDPFADIADMLPLEEIEIPAAETITSETAPVEVLSASAKRRRRRRKPRNKNKQNDDTANNLNNVESVVDNPTVEVTEQTTVADVEPNFSDEPGQAINAVEVVPTSSSSRRRNSRRRRKQAAQNSEEISLLTDLPIQEPIFQPMEQSEAENALRGMLDAIPGNAEVPAAEEKPAEQQNSLFASEINEVLPEVDLTPPTVKKSSRRRAPSRNDNKVNTKTEKTILEASVSAPLAVVEEVIVPVIPVESMVKTPEEAVDSKTPAKRGQRTSNNSATAKPRKPRSKKNNDQTPVESEQE